jgi:hypothetical protein
VYGSGLAPESECQDKCYCTVPGFQGPDVQVSQLFLPRPTGHNQMSQVTSTSSCCKQTGNFLKWTRWALLYHKRALQLGDRSSFLTRSMMIDAPVGRTLGRVALFRLQGWKCADADDLSQDEPSFGPSQSSRCHMKLLSI